MVSQCIFLSLPTHAFSIGFLSTMCDGHLISRFLWDLDQLDVIFTIFPMLLKQETFLIVILNSDLSVSRNATLQELCIEYVFHDPVSWNSMEFLLKSSWLVSILYWKLLLRYTSSLSLFHLNKWSPIQASVLVHNRVHSSVRHSTVLMSFFTVWTSEVPLDPFL
jgi:hypothetical protein